MFQPGPLILHAGQSLEVKGRRRLEGAAFEAFLTQLTQELEKRPNGCTISDLDLSQNKITFEQFEGLFSLLAQNHVSVKMFRLFGCPTLNDDAMRVIADFFRLVSAEAVPREMHLSDCAITTEGFLTLMAALEETELYPAMMGGMKPQALYLRLENNYIDEAAIQEKVDQGIIRPYRKTDPKVSEEGAKVDLVVKALGFYQQKQGTPPPPEKAPPPKSVHDRYQDELDRRQQVGGMMRTFNNFAGAWSQGWNAGGAPGAGPVQVRPPQVVRPAAALPAAGAWQKPGLQRPQGAAGGWQGQQANAGWQQSQQASGGWQQHNQQQSWPGAATARAPGAFNAFGAGAGANRWAGTAGTAADRSRTPAGRTVGGAAPARPAPPQQAAKSDLPPPWEEHFSDEYNIPYFWNAETGESLWEKPKF